MHFRNCNVGIIGLGLIGGSMASSLTAKKVCKSVIGWDRDTLVRERAAEENIVDAVVGSLCELASESDILILAVPLREMEKVSLKVRSLRKGCFRAVLDVGSTKEEIGIVLGDIWKESYVGVHPIAGKERGGIENRDPDLFKGSSFAVVPQPGSSEEAREIAHSIGRHLGARTLTVEPSEHDRIMACVSHLPIFISSALSILAKEEEARHPLLSSLIGNGFRDTTRVASGPAWLAGDIWGSNSRNMSDLLDRFMDILGRLGSSSPSEVEFLAESGRRGRNIIISSSERKGEKGSLPCSA
ncbi:MAG: prephenate dehydrogenase/arogenate dehydrogenase family protein [Synergistales bacterium]|nr:prephenate dehydrogenase/arogenate dehydrogenase family protein [Synergistales bacterium]